MNMQRRSLTGNLYRSSRSTSAQEDSVSANNAVESPMPLRHDISRRESSSERDRDSVSDSDDADEYPGYTGTENRDGERLPSSSQIMRCYRCEAMSDFVAGEALQVFICFASCSRLQYSLTLSLWYNL